MGSLSIIMGYLNETIFLMLASLIFVVIIVFYGFFIYVIIRFSLLIRIIFFGFISLFLTFIISLIVILFYPFKFTSFFS